MEKLRFAMFGSGFWSRYQLAGWMETGGVECVAICDPIREKAEARGRDYGITTIYTDPEELFKKEKLDFVDIVSSIETHTQLTRMAASHKLPVVCQKPLATSLPEAKEIVAFCEKAGVPLFVNENWRWQHAIRQFKHMLDEGRIGKAFRGRINFCNNYPVFDNQPTLKNLERFILSDMGSHILDMARFLFGEAHTVYCQNTRIHQDIRGEDVSTVMMTMGENHTTVICEMSFASRMENERFPETYAYVEGDKGYLELGPDFWIRETTDSGTLAKRYAPPNYPWANPDYAVVHSSIVNCQGNFVDALQGRGQAETTGADNLKTLQLIFDAYESMRTGQAIQY